MSAFRKCSLARDPAGQQEKGISRIYQTSVCIDKGDRHMHISFLCVRGVTTISSYSFRPPSHVESAFLERNSYSEIQCSIYLHIPAFHSTCPNILLLVLSWTEYLCPCKTPMLKPNSGVAAFGEGASEKELRLHEMIRVGVWSDTMSILIKKTPRIVLSLQTPKEIMWAQRNMAAACKPRGEASEWTLPGRHLSVNFQLPEMWEIHFCSFIFV